MELKIIFEAFSKRQKNQKTELSEASDLRKESKIVTGKHR